MTIIRNLGVSETYLKQNKKKNKTHLLNYIFIINLGLNFI